MAADQILVPPTKPEMTLSTLTTFSTQHSAAPSPVVRQDTTTINSRRGGLGSIKSLMAASVLAIVGLLQSGLALADCNSSSLRGSNIAGGEFTSSNLPGKYGWQYIYPNSTQISYAKSKNMTAIRVPVRWERVQASIYAELTTNDINLLKTVVSQANQQGLCVILDVHNFGTYFGKVIGSTEVSEDAFLDLWKKLAIAFPNTNGIAFGLMNEPKALTLSAWSGIAQRTVNGLRSAGAKHLLLISGAGYSGAQSWFSTDSTGASNASAFASFSDPQFNSVIEVHQYGDVNNNGTSATCKSTAQLQQIITNISNWAASTNHQMFLGETGVQANDACLTSLDGMLWGIDSAGSLWKGWSYWAAGAWWGTYPLSIEPANGVDKPQMSVLTKHL